MSRFSKRLAYANAIQLLTLLRTPQQQQAQVPFAGFGGLKELLLPLDDSSAWTPDDLRYQREVARFHELLCEITGTQYEAAIASLKNSTLTSFYTPAAIIDPLVTGIRQHHNTDIRDVLEPAAGIGNFIGPLRNTFPESTITAIEKDFITARILQALHPQVEVINNGYENFRTRQFDLVISNIPFGNVSVYDDQIFREAKPVKVKATTRIHNFYFVKSLDNLRNGGLLVFITTNGLMDAPTNSEIREHIVRSADLVTAIRLPNNTFEEAGTYPVTDIILLRKSNSKRNLSSSEKIFVRTAKIQVPDDKGLPVEVDVNAFYQHQPQNALGIWAAGGQYRGDSLTMLPAPGVTTQDAGRAIADLIQKGYHELGHHTPLSDDQKTIRQPRHDVLPENHPDYEILKKGSLIVLSGKTGSVDIEGDEKIVRPEPLARDAERSLHFVNLRNSLTRLVEAEVEGHQDKMQRLRKDLNDHYDLYVFRYGHLNHPANKKLFLLDTDGFKVLSLERPNGNSYTKADIFQRQVNNVRQQYARPESLKDAILHSLNAHNSVDIEFISMVMQRPQAAVIREGLDNELLFKDVETSPPSYVTKDVFLSGNIISKIESWENLIPEHHPGLTQQDVATHLARLKEARPVFLKRELIDINMGERWIPIDIYESFASHLFQERTEIKYLESADMYLVQVQGYSNADRITYAANTQNGTITGSRIMEYAMADTQPYLKVKVPGTDPPQYKPDADGMKNVEMKIREVKDAFENFLNTRKDIAGRIEVIYNRTINNAVRRNYDGAHLQLTGLKHFSLREHQKDAVWMLLQQDGGIVDHKVGAGKTLVMVAAAMEMRRLGIANKPLILCMKANVADVAKDFIKAYPDARVLAPDPQKDFNRQRRQRIFASIASNDWDAVIMTHDMFLAIPQSARVRKEILEQELKNLEDDLQAVRGNQTLSKRVLKGLESRKQNLAVRIMVTEAAIKRDDNILDFAKMGFDHIFVDESQAFKNLHFTTRHQQVAGLGDPAGSQRALNLELAVRTIQEKKGGDRGATFLSGTTISNSLVELYLLFKYLRPAKLRELSINSFDAWAKMYARKSATYEFTVTNELKMKERYREFIKVPELARFYSEITHVVNDNNLRINKPSVENIIINMEPTPAQDEYTQKLINFTRTKNPAYVDLSMAEKGMNAFMLIATNLARKMSIDMRLIDAERYDVGSAGKVAQLSQTVAEEYRDSTPYKGTQLIFSDIGTPDGNGFNLYAAIKHVLVTHHGLNPAEVQFVHDHDTKKKKEALFRDVNNGDVRVLIGSTKKLGTGVNVQERVIAMHHLDIPWRPSDFEQRIGRGGRQGNRSAHEFRNNTVRNYIYAVNRTLDAYQFNILSNKQKFISQIKNSSIDQRKIDEGALDQEGGMNFGEYVALLSGNSDLLEKVKLEKKLYDLERTYQVFLKRQSEASFYIDLHTRQRKEKEVSLAKLEKDWESIHPRDLEGLVIVVGDRPVPDRKTAGEMLHERIEAIRREQSREDSALARLEDFVLLYNPSQAKVFINGPSGITYHYADGKLHENNALAGRYMIDSLKRIPKVIENTREAIDGLSKKIETYQQERTVDFKDKTVIADLKRQIDQLGARLEKVFAQQPELEGSSLAEDDVTYKAAKPRRRVRSR